MAYSVTTSLTDLQKLGKQVHAGVFLGAVKRSEAFKLFKQMKDFDMNPSQRSVTFTLDLLENGVGSFISEGGRESDPKTVAPVDATVTWANYNDRWSFTKTSQYLDAKHTKGLLMKQAKFQTIKMVEGLCKRVGIALYGASSGVICQTSTNATQANGTYTLEDGFDQSTIDNAAYLAGLFTTNDRVALVRSGAIVANSAGGDVTARSLSAGTIAVTWSGPVDSDANDQVVFSNSTLSDSGTSLAYTDYNKAPYGLTEMATATSLFGISGSTYDNWNAAHSDTGGGDLTGTKLKKGQHEITFKGTGAKANLLIMAPGVARRLYQTTSNAVQFNDPLGMEVLGSVKTGGIKQHAEDPLCPPGWAFLLDDREFFKWSLVDFPSDTATSLEGLENSNIDKLQDVNGSVFSFDLPFNFLTKKRAAMAYWNGLTES